MGRLASGPSGRVLHDLYPDPRVLVVPGYPNISPQISDSPPNRAPNPEAIARAIPDPNSFEPCPRLQALLERIRANNPTEAELLAFPNVPDAYNASFLHPFCAPTDEEDPVRQWGPHTVSVVTPQTVSRDWVAMEYSLEVPGDGAEVAGRTADLVVRVNMMAWGGHARERTTEELIHALLRCDSLRVEYVTVGHDFGDGPPKV